MYFIISPTFYQSYFIFHYILLDFYLNPIYTRTCRQTYTYIHARAHKHVTSMDMLEETFWWSTEAKLLQSTKSGSPETEQYWICRISAMSLSSLWRMPSPSNSWPINKTDFLRDFFCNWVKYLWIIFEVFNNPNFLCNILAVYESSHTVVQLLLLWFRGC